MNGFRSRPAEKREDYSPVVAIGLGLAVVLLLAFGAYWVGDGPRLEAAAAGLRHERVRRGESLYADQCAACHGLEGQGGVGPALKDRTVLKNTPDQIFFSVIRSGVPNTQMPSWSVDFGGPLTDEDIHDLVAFLRAWEPEAPEVALLERQPDPNQGALLFSGTCAVCHGEDGQGGKPGIPALNDPDRLGNFDNAWYRSVISYGRPAKGMPTWGTVLAPAQINDLVALLAAWRQGQDVRPAYALSDLLDLAYFALSQNDAASGRLHVERALEIGDGQAAELLSQIAVQIDTGDLAGAVAALAALEENWPPGDSLAGAQVYAAHCAVCHGEQGEGGLGKALVGSQFVQAQSNAGLTSLIQEGRPGTAMTGFSEQLSSQQIADLVAWLRTWQK